MIDTSLARVLTYVTNTRDTPRPNNDTDVWGYNLRELWGYNYGGQVSLLLLQDNVFISKCEILHSNARIVCLYVHSN